jgi:hypothetical protein
MSDTYTYTYNRQDIRRVHASFEADYRIVAEWTELHSPGYVDRIAAQIKALAEAEYLREVHLQLQTRNGAIRQAAVYRVSTNASSWSADRPGDLYWESFDGDLLVLVVYFSEKWDQLDTVQQDEFSKAHLDGWGTSDFDGNYGSLSRSVDRHYTSRAYGLERTRYSE